MWCPKYRRPVLTSEVESRLRQLLAEKAVEVGMTIHALEVMPDHIHLFVEADPTLSVAEIINRFKGYTSRVLRQEFAMLRSRLPTLWSRSYYCGTVGAVSEATVQAATSPTRRGSKFARVAKYRLFTNANQERELALPLQGRTADCTMLAWAGGKRPTKPISAR